MRKITVLLAFLFFAGLNFAYAQTRTINGTVTSSDNGQALPGVTVQVKGTTVGTITDLNGKYSIDVNLKQGNTLVYSFVGMGTQEIAIGKSNTINVVMKSSAMAINEVVVTALGVTREKKALGYATQQVSGASLDQVKSDNVINGLSGRVSGVDVKTSGNLGGSTNVIIRGSTSLTGSNQALFVVDGVPMSNSTPNSGYQAEGGGGYDFGSVVSDIDPSNIESVSILKGAAATALYGSRAANGVIMITTKTGNDDKYLGKHGLGISFSSNVTVGTVDRSTFPKYQNQYGAGYYPYYSAPYGYPGPGQNPFLLREMVNGVMSWVAPTTEDASLGAKFDPNLMVYQWDAFVPQSPNYGKATPWVAAKNGPITFFKPAVSNSNTIAVNGVSNGTSFRFAYTRFDQTGIMPNSKLTKNSFSLNASHKIAKNLTISSVANYVHQYALGRNGTGYSTNLLTSFRQWWEVNVDVKELKAMYDATGKNVTWNMNNPVKGDFTPAYWNNYYWERYNNYEDDSRDHLFGNTQVKWDITDNLSVVGMATLETYTTMQEWRLAVGSWPTLVGLAAPGKTPPTAPSGYARQNISSTESNYKLMITYTKNITSKLNLKAMAGGNIRRDNYSSIYAATSGGLVVPGLYSLANSVSSPLAPRENVQTKGINSLFADVSLGYNNLLYLDATLRADRSSTLPISNDTYLYPSVSGSFIFSNLLHASWLPFAKLRLNYAEVGNDAPFGSLYDTYNMGTPFGGVSTGTLPLTENNPNLKPELTKSVEAGLTANFVHNRVGFDVDYYHTNTINQIMPVQVSSATGYGYKYFNAGTIANQGVELTVHGTPIQNKNFSWHVTVNWSMNRNKVVSLYNGSKNLVLGGLFGVSVNARVGQPYGVLEGSNYVYYKNTGERIMINGLPEVTSSTTNVLGNTTPKWQGGISNTFKYKNWSLSFLIDVSKGGSVYSLDQAFGQSTGIYATSVGLNAKGNPKRNWVQDGGGILNKGVNPDGSPNTTYVQGNNTFNLGFNAFPDAAFIYDASYVKLREAELDYRFPQKMVERIGIRNLTLGFVGSNLWIIFKNLPYADPETGTGAGNVQALQSGVMPTTRNFGFNLKVQF